ncbi:MAG TPA: DUF4407 domain-containing protein [Deltaproteobacteria bacterium]|nr:DUF4407 domain-containing protein [Deltaproteobacteria bacterium]
MGVSRYFYFLAGTSEGVIQDCPESERNYHTAIGGFVLITAIAASMSGGYALYTIFHSAPIALVFGIFWGLTIGAIDRFIVMTLDLTMHGSRARGLITASARLILAVFVAFVIARPLELRIFAPEINARLQGEVLQQLDDSVSQIAVELERRQLAYEGNDRLVEERVRYDALAAEHIACRLEEGQLRDAVHGECDGTRGTGRVGVGPICRLKSADLQEVKDRCASLHERLIASEALIASVTEDNDRVFGELRAEAEAQIAALQRDSQERIEAIAEGREGSLLTRLDALHGLAAQSSGMWWALWFITLLFILIEVLPVGLKLMVAGQGTYGRRVYLDERESAKRHRIERKLRERERIKHRTVLTEITEAVREQQRERLLKTISSGVDVVAHDANLELRRRTEVRSQDLTEARTVFPPEETVLSTDDDDDEDQGGASGDDDSGIVRVSGRLVPRR